MPAPAFLRVRELVDGRPGKILKQSGHTLRYVQFNLVVELRVRAKRVWLTLVEEYKVHLYNYVQHYTVTRYCRHVIR